MCPPPPFPLILALPMVIDIDICHENLNCLEIYMYVNLFINMQMFCLFQVSITLKVISGIYPGVSTVELDTLAAETAAAMTTKHPDYAILAARIAVSNLHKETRKAFSGNLIFYFYKHLK